MLVATRDRSQPTGGGPVEGKGLGGPAAGQAGGRATGRSRL